MLWSSKAQTVSISVDPSAVVSCTAWDGAPLACSNIDGGVELKADLGPIYLVSQ
jgi:hypothetical protein